MAEGSKKITPRLEFGSSLIAKDMQDGILIVQNVIGGDYAVALGRELRDIVRERGQAPLKVLIFSGGGGVYAAFHVYDMLRSYAENYGKVTTVACGMVASAAAGIVLQAGDERQATPNTRLMLHEVASWYTHDTAIATSQHDDAAAEMKMLQGMMCDLLGQRSNHDAEYWQNVIKRTEAWYSADQALEHGIIDTITHETPGIVAQ